MYRLFYRDYVDREMKYRPRSEVKLKEADHVVLRNGETGAVSRQNYCGFSVRTENTIYHYGDSGLYFSGRLHRPEFDIVRINGEGVSDEN